MTIRKLGPYTITEEIGAGGMATVFRAYQSSMDRHVAIKVIRSGILQHPTLKDRFRREARLIARLEHPHLLPVYDFDGDHDPPYIVMRYLDGGTLKQVLAQGELPFDEMLYMLNQVGAALDYAHRQGVVHRDLKPSNVMIDREGNAFVTDFGIARAAGTHEALTNAGDLIGTPAYMSPEQARGETDVGPAADVYALGAMIFEVLTGSIPFEHDSSLGVLMAHQNDPVPSARARNGRVPEGADRVLRAALAKEPSARPATAGALIADLATALRVNGASSPRRLQELTVTLSLSQLKAFEAQKKAGQAETPSAATPTEQQRQMTTVHLDVTELVELLYESGKDAETVRVRMDALWSRFGEIARERGGVIQSRADGIGLALWGRARISEDDPERAIRATLRMRDAVADEARALLGKSWEPSEENPLPFSAGIATGPVLLERTSETGTYTASGATITLAGRIQDAAEPGTILVAHDTFTLVRGVFTFHPHEAIRLRGRKEPLDVYAVTGVKQRAFRQKARGIEGIETKMIGRENELRLLQEAMTLTLEDGDTQVVTVVGDAGVGKSRLLFEFATWSDLIEQQFWLFEARATAPSMLQPYSLTRDLFSFRFQILDSDPLDLVHRKFVDGVAAFLGEDTRDKAELMGQVVGFDFSNRPVVAEALKDPDAFRHRALGYLGEFFTAATRVHPVVIQIEDIHWADDRSLDLINNLVRENERLPMFVMCLARPSLYERRPQWGEGQRFHERVELEPLSQLSSRRLVRELLKRMAEVPRELRDLVVERADGNPFYIEELIKALIDDGVIIKGEQAWSVDQTRLSSVRIPPTLTGVLQSRLDSLPMALQQLLQRVSVMGRVFWDAAAFHLCREAGFDDEDVRGLLEDLRQREMILRREESGFAGTVEYVFRHAILRDVTYGTLSPRQRRALHKVAAEWLLEMGRARAGEQILLVAEHYEQAGEPVLASEQLRGAGEQATRVGAHEEALTTLLRARELVKSKEHRPARFEVELSLGQLHSSNGRLDEGKRLIEEMLPDVREAGDTRVLARALGLLGRFALWQDDAKAALRHLEEGLSLARALGDERGLIFILRQLGNLQASNPAVSVPLIEESIALARRLGDRVGECYGLNSMGIVISFGARAAEAIEKYRQALQIARELGDRTIAVAIVGNLGATHLMMGQLDRAWPLMNEALELARDLGDHPSLANSHENLAEYCIVDHQDDAARDHLRDALVHFRGSGTLPSWLLPLMAVLEARSGRQTRGLEWIGLFRSTPTSNEGQGRVYIDAHLAEIQGDLPESEVRAALERGAALNLEQVIEEWRTG